MCSWLTRRFMLNFQLSSVAFWLLFIFASSSLASAASVKPRAICLCIDFATDPSPCIGLYEAIRTKLLFISALYDLCTLKKLTQDKNKKQQQKPHQLIASTLQYKRQYPQPWWLITFDLMTFSEGEKYNISLYRFPYTPSLALILLSASCLSLSLQSIPVVVFAFTFCLFFCTVTTPHIL